jgi:lipopolysaccharide heptosyltransferase I
MPEAVIDWLIEDRFASLLETFPGLQEVIQVPRRKGSAWRGLGEYAALRKRLAGKGYSVAVDFQGLTKSAIWPWLARVPRRIGYGDEDGRELSKLFYNDRVIPDPSLKHVAERNLALAERLTGGEGERTEIREYFPVDGESASWAEEYLRENNLSGVPVALLVSGVSWASKRWPAEYFGVVAEWFVREQGGQCLVSWGPGEDSLAGRVAEGREGVYVLPETSLPRLAAVAKRCRICIANDTGPFHLAAAVGTPCVGVYGPTDPGRNGPYGAPSRAVSAPPPCAPCWQPECREANRKCLDGLEPEKVIRAAEDLLAETGEAE